MRDLWKLPHLDIRDRESHHCDKVAFVLKPGTRSVPMTFRARTPTDHDIAEDVRSTGGIIDIQPEGGVYETTAYLQDYISNR